MSPRGCTSQHFYAIGECSHFPIWLLLILINSRSNADLQITAGGLPPKRLRRGRVYESKFYLPEG